MSKVLEKIQGTPDMTVEESLNLYEQAIKENPKDSDLRLEYANRLLDWICLSATHYADYEIVRESDLFKRLKKVVETLDNKQSGFQLFYIVISLINGRNDLARQYLKESFRENREKGVKTALSVSSFMYSYMQPLKAGFPNMWTMFGNEMRSLGSDLYEAGLPEFCDALELFYRSKKDEPVMEALSQVCVQFPNIYPAAELLGNIYYDLKLWKNALACYQQVEEKIDDPKLDSNHISFPEDLYFQMAWCYGKIRDYEGEETCYRKALAMAPNLAFARNNLAYCLYRQKRYAEAEELYRACIADGADLRYTVNGLARTLLASGKLPQAKALLTDQEKYLSKDMKRRIREGRRRAIPEETAEEAPVLERERQFRSYQFTSERILEDELVNRMERGQEVFGLKLSVYERKGVYGRQYALPGGRIDILAEDLEGNLYAVELKKDSGYDDPYPQTIRYVEWLSKNLCKPGKKAYGIICLSDPKPALVEQVRKDKRVRMFEYRISYSEVL